MKQHAWCAAWVGLTLITSGCSSLLGADFGHGARLDGSSAGDDEDDDDASQEPDPGVRNGTSSSGQTHTSSSGHTGGSSGHTGGSSSGDGASSGGSSTSGSSSSSSGSPPVPVLRPSNADALGHLPTSGNDVVLSQASTVDTDQCIATIGTCAPHGQASGPEVCVCTVGSLVLGDLTVRGSRGLAIFAHGDVTVTGHVRVGGAAQTDGPGCGTSTKHGAFEPLIGGEPGSGPRGGGGGGGLQISAGGTLTLAATGAIDASGGGGAHSGGDGGGGGTVLLEAESVHVLGDVSANGGGGGGGDSTSTGSAGTSGEDGASWGGGSGGAGWFNVICRNPSESGGDGGNGADRDHPIPGYGSPGGSNLTCGMAPYPTASGGDGGALGLLRIATASAAQLVVEGVASVSPAPVPAIVSREP